MELKLFKQGEDLLVVIPEELRAQLQWQPGDVINAEIACERLTLVRTETAHNRAMKIARKAMANYHDVFVKLAKS